MKKYLKLLMSLTFFLTACQTSDETTATASASAEATPNAGSLDLTTQELDMSAYRFLTDDDPAFIEVSTAESLRLFSEGGTGIVVYSYESCEWCNRIIPILNTAAKEYGIEVFYVNIYSDDFLAKDSTDQANIIQSLYDVLTPILDTELNEETGEYEPQFRVPLVVAVKDGEITAHHVGIVDSFTLDFDNLDDYQVTEDQQAELIELYKEMFATIE